CSPAGRRSPAEDVPRRRGRGRHGGARQPLTLPRARPSGIGRAARSGLRRAPSVPRRGNRPGAPLPPEGLPLLELLLDRRGARPRPPPPRAPPRGPFSWAGEPLDDDTPTPDRHDGMAVVADLGRELVLVRNHERTGDAGVFAKGAPVYDPAAAGGTGALPFDTRHKEVVRSYASLTGTLTNCAGGPTPWGSWLSCEENVDGNDLSPASGLTERHGYVFEVSAQGAASAEPLRAMALFRHEACAVEPASGAVYQTEDETAAGFYRFVPAEPGKLAA